MNKNNADLLKILVLVAIIIIVFILSGKYLQIEPQKPAYQDYEQDSRLERISKGLRK